MPGLGLARFCPRNRIHPYLSLVHSVVAVRCCRHCRCSLPPFRLFATTVVAAAIYHFCRFGLQLCLPPPPSPMSTATVIDRDRRCCCGCRRSLLPPLSPSLPTCVVAACCRCCRRLNHHRGPLELLLRPQPPPPPPSTETAVASVVAIGRSWCHHLLLLPTPPAALPRRGHCDRVEYLAINVGPSLPLPDGPIIDA